MTEAPSAACAVSAPATRGGYCMKSVVTIAPELTPGPCTFGAYVHTRLTSTAALTTEIGRDSICAMSATFPLSDAEMDASNAAWLNQV